MDKIETLRKAIVFALTKSKEEPAKAPWSAAIDRALEIVEREFGNKNVAAHYAYRELQVKLSDSLLESQYFDSDDIAVITSHLREIMLANTDSVQFEIRNPIQYAERVAAPTDVLETFRQLLYAKTIHTTSEVTTIINCYKEAHNMLPPESPAKPQTLIDKLDAGYCDPLTAGGDIVNRTVEDAIEKVKEAQRIAAETFKSVLEECNGDHKAEYAISQLEQAMITIGLLPPTDLKVKLKLTLTLDGTTYINNLVVPYDTSEEDVQKLLNEWRDTVVTTSYDWE